VTIHFFMRIMYKSLIWMKYSRGVLHSLTFSRKPHAFLLSREKENQMKREISLGNTNISILIKIDTYTEENVFKSNIFNSLEKIMT